MLGVELIFLFTFLGAMVVGVFCVVLSFRGYRPLWHLAVGVMPSFLVGNFYTLAFLLGFGQQGTYVTVAIYWLNATIGIVCLSQIARRMKETN